MNDQTFSYNGNTKSKQSSRRSTLMEELHSIIEQNQFAELIRWAPDGQSFIITIPEVFENTVLPKICNHSNFASFIRQLNMYGFKKKSVRGGATSYTHNLFIKGHSEFLKSIIRRNPRKEAQARRKKQEDRHPGLLLKDIGLRSEDEEKSQQEIKGFLPREFKEFDDPETDISFMPIDYSSTQNKDSVNNYETEVLSMIRNYLKDDDDNEFEGFDPYNDQRLDSGCYKRVKTLSECSNGLENSRKQLENKYIQLDLLTGDCDKRSKRANPPAQVSQFSYLFRASDYFECQNLISAMGKYKTECYSPDFNSNCFFPMTNEINPSDASY